MLRRHVSYSPHLQLLASLNKKHIKEQIHAYVHTYVTPGLHKSPATEVYTVAPDTFSIIIADFCLTYKHRRTKIFFLGGGADPEGIYNSCLILKTVMKIVSRSSSRHLVRLQGKFILYIPKFLLYFSVLQCTSHQLISVADLG
jgi:hypothetical protein